MAHSSTVLNRMVRHLPRGEFEKIVHEHNGNWAVRSFKCWSLFLRHVHARLSDVDSLRDLETTLRSERSALYHVGLENFSRCTMADANESRNPLIFEGMFTSL